MSLSRTLITSCPIALLAALSIQVHAQTQVQPQAQVPIQTPAPTAAAPWLDGGADPESATSGTTIIGDQESQIGLYITPWKDDYAERGLDRPARLVDEAMEPIDPATFRRQIEYYEAITAFRKSRQGAAK